MYKLVNHVTHTLIAASLPQVWDRITRAFVTCKYNIEMLYTIEAYKLKQYSTFITAPPHILTLS